MSERKMAYRSVLKATSLFGGVQVFNILIAIIRSKVIALWIGPVGYGISSLFTTTMGLVDGITNLSLDRSAVKEIAFYDDKKDVEKVTRLASVLQKLVQITAISGALLMIIFSALLSKLAFGDTTYTISFIWIALALLFKQLTQGKLALLQGFRKLNHLAKANLYGNFIGLLLTLPLYYFFRIDAIVPSMIIATIISFCLATYFANKLQLEKQKINGSTLKKEGAAMIQLGVMLSLSSMITLAVAYVIQVFISYVGGVSEVGLYSAGMLILNSYVGIIFNAMATDYFPRLSAVADNIEKIKTIVYEQAYIAILIITPIVVLFIIVAQYAIVLLYSSDFKPIELFVTWGILGMLFKTVSWSMGYIIIAKGDSNLFIKTTIAFNSILLLCNGIGYYYFGLEGLGVSFLIYYFIHFVSLYFITKKRYEFYFYKGFYTLFLFCVTICLLTFISNFISIALLKYCILGCLLIISVGVSYKKLDQKMDLKEMITSKFKKR